MSCQGRPLAGHAVRTRLAWLLFANTDLVLPGSLVGSQDLRLPWLLFRKTIRKMSAPGRIKLNEST